MVKESSICKDEIQPTNKVTKNIDKTFFIKDKIGLLLVSRIYP